MSRPSSSFPGLATSWTFRLKPWPEELISSNTRIRLQRQPGRHCVPSSGAVSLPRWPTLYRMKCRDSTVCAFNSAMKSSFVVCCFLACASLCTSRGATVPLGFSETIVPGPNAGAWNEAVGLAFDSAGRMFVWERPGRVWFKDTNDTSFSLLLDISEEVGDWGDYGCLGFAVDPNFRQNGYIYLLYTVDRHHLLYFGTPAYDPAANEYSAATIGRLTRYTCRASDGFRSVDASSRFILIGETIQTGFPLCSDGHGIGSLVFGEDGTLLASCGDGSSAVDTDVGGTHS